MALPFTPASPWGIYVDEAGTSQREPVRVAVALAVPDGQKEKIQEALNSVFDQFVPAEIRPGFVFHATEIMSGKGCAKKAAWSLAERLDLIKAVVSLPRAFSLPLGVSAHHRSFEVHLPKIERIKAYEFQHMMAFRGAIERIDHFLRNHLEGKASGYVVAEDSPAMRKKLKAYWQAMLQIRMMVDPAACQTDQLQAKLGIHNRNPEFSINYISPELTFLKKGSESMLEIADACAFVVRRWVSGHVRAEDFVYAMAGEFLGETFIGDAVWMNGPANYSLIDHLYDAAFISDRSGGRIFSRTPASWIA